MAAANNVFGAVHEYASDAFVFGKVFTFVGGISGDPIKGWPTIAITSAFVVRRISPVFVSKQETAAFVAKRG